MLRLQSKFTCILVTHITAVDGLYHHYWGGAKPFRDTQYEQKSKKQVTKYILYEKVGGIQDSKAILQGN